MQRAYGLRALGDVLRDGGDLPGAESVLEEALALARRVGDRIPEAGALISLSKLRRKEGNYAEASALARAGLRVYQSMGNPMGRTVGWLSLAATAAAEEHWAEAAACFSAAEACGVYGAADTEYADDEALRATLHVRPSPADFEGAWARGRTLTGDDYGLR